MEQKTNLSSKQSSGQPVYENSQKNKKIGLFLIISPIIAFISLFMFWGLANYIIDPTGTSTDITSTSLRLVNVIFGFIGILIFIGIMVGIPLGILYLGKKELAEGAKYDERSGKKEDSVVPDEIAGWNWGAAGLTWVWGIYHGVWISLLTFIPLVNIIVVIVLGVKGSEWAWRAQKWESVEKFIASQKKWKPWGIIFFALMILGLISTIT